MKYNNPSLNIASDIHYKNFKFKNYTFECIDNKKYIVGNDSVKIIKIENHIIDTLCDEIVKTDLLSDIIRLKQQLPKFNLPYYNNLVDEKNIDFVDEIIDKKSINLIIKFCNKHGMPFIGDSTFDNFLGIAQLGINEYKHFGFDNNHNTRMLLHKYAFRIGTFVIGISIIYNAFIFGLVFNNKEIINNSNGDVALELDNICSQFNFVEKHKDEASKIFTTIINSMNIYLQPIISKNMKTHTYKIYGKTLLSCALYQLLQFITSNNKEVKTCKQCHTIFIASRKDVKYCSGACRVKYCRTHPNKKTR